MNINMKKNIYHSCVFTNIKLLDIFQMIKTVHYVKTKFGCYNKFIAFVESEKLYRRFTKFKLETLISFVYYNPENGLYTFEKNSNLSLTSLENILYVDFSKSLYIYKLPCDYKSFNMLTIVPELAINKYEKQDYVYQLANKCELWGKKKKNYELREQNNIINSTSFDPEIGGLKFYDFEWILIPNSNPLKHLFSKKVDKSYVYLLETDNSVILRGAGIYYWQACSKTEFEKLSFYNINQWCDNCILFLTEIILALNQFKIIGLSFEYKLIFGVLDNLRNISLQFLNAMIILSMNGFNEFCIPNNYHPYIQVWNNITSNVIALMTNLCRGIVNVDYKNQVLILVKTTKQEIVNSLNNIEKQYHKKNNLNFNEMFRLHRDNDNFYENYMSVQELHNHYKVIPNYVESFAILYGGLELPYIFKALYSKNTKYTINYIKLGDNYAERHYSNNSLYNLSDIYIAIKKTDSYKILFDDNIGTGITIQNVLNILGVHDILFDKICVIRHPAINRLPQYYASKFIVNLKLCETFCNGMLYSAPYTKVSPKHIQDYSFLDEFGIFNTTVYSYLKYLKTNGLYDVNSDVAQFNISL